MDLNSALFYIENETQIQIKDMEVDVLLIKNSKKPSTCWSFFREYWKNRLSYHDEFRVHRIDKPIVEQLGLFNV